VAAGSEDPAVFVVYQRSGILLRGLPSLRFAAYALALFAINRGVHKKKREKDVSVHEVGAE
jgi:hypothetical protein